MKRRPRVLPAGVSPEAWDAIIEEYDRRLRAGGFVDIEGGRDLNVVDGWTFRGGADGRNHGGHVAVAEPSELAPAAFAVLRFWAVTAQLARELPAGYRHRRFLVLATELGSVNGAAVRCGFGARSWRAYRVWRQFLYEKGLAASPFIPRPRERPYRRAGRPAYEQRRGSA